MNALHKHRHHVIQLNHCQINRQPAPAAQVLTHQQLCQQPPASRVSCHQRQRSSACLSATQHQSRPATVVRAVSGGSDSGSSSGGSSSGGSSGSGSGSSGGPPPPGGAGIPGDSGGHDDGSSRQPAHRISYSSTQLSYAVLVLGGVAGALLAAVLWLLRAAGSLSGALAVLEGSLVRGSLMHPVACPVHCKTRAIMYRMKEYAAKLFNLLSIPPPGAP